MVYVDAAEEHFKIISNLSCLSSCIASAIAYIPENMIGCELTNSSHWVYSSC